MESTFEYQGVRITWLKHAGFQIKNSAVIYIDPYDVNKRLERADIILITHEHFDHMDFKSIKNLSKPDTTIVHPKGCIVEGYQTCEIDVNSKVTIKGIEIQAVPAYNIDKPFHKSGCVGYVINVNGVNIYHAGDTDRIPEMKEINVDIALLPIGGTYTMDVKEAVEAAKDINAKFFIPMHYGEIPSTEANPEEFKKEVKNAVILKPLL